MMLYTKYESSVVSDKKIFESCILKTYFLTRYLLMQQIRTIWTILVEDYLGTIPIEFGPGSREEVIWSFPHIIQC